MAHTVKPTDWRTAYACQALKFSIYLGAALVTTPFDRIFEADVCRNYYRKTDPTVIDSNDDILEELCKVSPVQQGVSNINGVQSGVDMFPNLISAIVYLALLQRMQKKQVLLLNVTGFLFMNLYYAAMLYFYNTFDPRWIIATSAFSLIGGGYPVFNSLIPALLAESLPQESLSSFQLYTSAISMLVKVVGTSASLSIMKWSLWLPVVLGLLIYASLIPLVFYCFKGSVLSLRTTQTSGIARDEYARFAVNDEAIELSSTIPDDQPHSSISTQSRPRVKAFSAIWNFIRQHVLVLGQHLLPCAVIMSRDIGQSFLYILPFWMSRRYHWELREVGWVKLCENLFSVVVISVLPRFAKRFLQRPSVSASNVSMATAARTELGLDGANDSQKEDDHEDSGDTTTTNVDRSSTYRDLSLAKLCILLSALGVFLLGLSWHRVSAIVSLAMFAGGIGFQDAYFSYLAGTMPNKDKSNLATVYMMLSMVTEVGFGIGGSIVSGIYSVALNIGGDSWATSVPLWFCTIGFVGAWWALRRH